MSENTSARIWRLARTAALPLVIGVVWAAMDVRVPQAAAQDEEPAKALPADLDLVPRSAAGFVTLRLGELWTAPYMKKARSMGVKEWRDVPADLEADLGIDPSQVERLTLFLIGNGGIGGYLFLVTTTKPYELAKVKASMPGAKEETVKGKAIHVCPSGRKALVLVSDRSYLLGEPDDVKAFLTLPKGKKDGPLTAALAFAGGKHLIAGGINGPRLAELMDKVGEKLPPAWAPFRPLLRARPLAFSLDVGDKLHAHVTLGFSQEEEARTGEKDVREALTLARKALAELAGKASPQEKLVLFAPLESGLKESRIDRRGTSVRVEAVTQLNPLIVAGSLMSGIGGAHNVIVRNASMGNLKLLGLTFHKYLNQHRCFPPPAIYGKDGKPLLSWRVAILPLMGEEEAKLYKQFKLDEPWDSAHNKKLLARMPAVFAPPRKKAAGPGETYYQGFIGKSAFFEDKKGTRRADLPDGLAKTITVVEADKPVPWTKPEDIPFDPSRPVPKLGGLFEKGFNALFADGHVTFFSRDIKLEDLKPLITRNARDRIRLRDY